MITALRATSETLAAAVRRSLRAEATLTALFAAPGAVSLATPDEMAQAGVTGLSVWLYRVDRDDMLLNMDEETVDAGLIRRRPLPVRLHYLFTPIISLTAATAPETEQHILGAVLQTFHDHPFLRGPDLQGDFAGTDVELTVRLEHLAIEETTRIWDSLDRSYQLCLSYEVSVVLIASRLPDQRVPIVIGAEIEAGTAVAGPLP
jgi:hypothetical protein